MIDHESKLLFIHVPRTGGTSIEKALVNDDWWKIESSTKHLSAAQARVLYGEAIWNDYTTFAVVRNPWDRLVSMWTIGYWYGPDTVFKGVKPKDFSEFVHNLKPHPVEYSLHQYVILDEELDYILRYDDLQGEFSRMLRELKLPEKSLPFMEKSENRKHYRDYYDAELANFVASAYAIDIERFKFSF